MSKTYRRFDSLQAVRENQPSHAEQNGATPPRSNNSADFDVTRIFGENMLQLDTLKERLPKSVWQELKKTIRDNEPLNQDVADAVAVVMKDWAIERGATHYTHWFQPLTGHTAEKHDSFFTPNQGGGAVNEFSGKDLIQGEPDASSLPSGGLRPTFEARGYTAWDPTSPAFIVENRNGAVLCIPTAFASWKGEALDHKTPLIRSTEALNHQSLRTLRLFGDESTKWVNATGGFEQEYFLVDQEFYYRRPDLLTCNRTLFGTQPPRGQELDDHYFGSIPDRILSFMMDVERELYRLGVPVKTRHNEVAPGQFEIAPVFEKCNVAADHQQLTMIMLKKIARQYGLVCLLHEKPFAGLNGSGKHANWSLTSSEGHNLLEPGDNPHSNMQFLFFFTAVIKAVHDYQEVLRASIASAGNDHRLGGNEAPPAILSVFVGEQLQEILDQLTTGKPKSSRNSGLLGLGSQVLPDLPQHASDRNRTSPFAFTGNKFEFRGVGADQSVSFPLTVLNTAVAEALDQMNGMLEQELENGKEFEQALSGVLGSVIKQVHPILFNGDGYSSEWEQEAARRGLSNLKTTMEALPRLKADRNIKLFEKHEVLSRKELESRYAIMTEQYFMSLNIEAESTESVARTMLIPAAARYMNELLAMVERGGQAGLTVSRSHDTTDRLNRNIEELIQALDELEQENNELGGDSGEEKAQHVHQNVLPKMNQVREIADRMEGQVADDYWPLPSYRDMLFVK